MKTARREWIKLPVGAEDFLGKKVVKGKLLLMNFQLKCKKTVNGEKNPKRFSKGALKKIICLIL